MSNNLVGTIYQQIINEVIEASRVDFEDQGVGEDVLDELRRVRFLPPFLVTHQTTSFLLAACQFIPYHTISKICSQFALNLMWVALVVDDLLP